MSDPVIIGDCTLYLGDCLEILPTLEAGSVDAILTDIPYGTTQCSWDEIIPFVPMWREVKRMLKQRGVFVTTASQPFTSKLVMSNLDWFKYEWIWDKKTPGNVYSANLRPLKYHENLLVFYKQQPTYNPQKTKGERNHQRKAGNNDNGKSIYGNPPRTQADLSGLKFPSSILEFQKHSASEDLHPTQKPVDLYSYLTRTYSNEGDIILDFTMGSGTTGVACVQTGRKFIGIEIDPHYFDIACKRIKQASLQMRMDI